MLAQIQCNTLIIMLIIGLTMIFCVSPLLAVCSLSLQGNSCSLSHGMAKEAPSDVLQLPQCMDRVIQYNPRSISLSLHSNPITQMNP